MRYRIETSPDVFVIVRAVNRLSADASAKWFMRQYFPPDLARVPIAREWAEDYDVTSVEIDGTEMLK